MPALFSHNGIGLFLILMLSSLLNFEMWIEKKKSIIENDLLENTKWLPIVQCT